MHLAGKAASKYKERPYGMTLFKNATGRVCDGRVLIDFYGEYIAPLNHFLLILKKVIYPSSILKSNQHPNFRLTNLFSEVCIKKPPLIIQ